MASSGAKKWITTAGTLLTGGLIAGGVWFWLGEGPSGKGEGDKVTDPPAAGAEAPPAILTNSIELDGFDDHLVVSNNRALDGGRAYSFEAWIHPTSMRLSGIMSKRKDNTAQTSYSLLLAPERRALRLFFKVNDEDDSFKSRQAIPLNQWTHVAAVFDGDTHAGERKKIYINGKLERTGFCRSEKIKSHRTDLGIGILLGNYSSYFTGRMDDVRIWNRALTDEEIARNMCRGLQGSEADLLAYWHFNNSLGTVEKNQTALPGIDAAFINMSDSVSRIVSNLCVNR